jgi:hypothetical protein
MICDPVMRMIGIWTLSSFVLDKRPHCCQVACKSFPLENVKHALKKHVKTVFQTALNNAKLVQPRGKMVSGSTAQCRFVLRLDVKDSTPREVSVHSPSHKSPEFKQPLRVRRGRPIAVANSEGAATSGRPRRYPLSPEKQAIRTQCGWPARRCCREGARRAGSRLN